MTLLTDSTTRDEYLAWCKKRALEYVDLGDLQNAVTSMMSDLAKHEGTNLKSAGAPLGMLGIMAAINGDAEEVRRWIIGFN